MELKTAIASSRKFQGKLLIIPAGLVYVVV